MIAFASLFLGLIVGTRPVTVIVGNTVAAVEFELDGRTLGRLSKAPWTREVDFGMEFEPHELVARAFDEKGGEVALARQWINLPRPPAEVQLVLERDARGRAAWARVTFESILGVHPNRVSVTFDGKALPFEGGRVAIPGHDPQSTHVLTAVVDYPDGVQTRNDLVIGGASSGEAGSELTAVPIRWNERDLPKPAALRGRFLSHDRPLAVAAVEHGPAQVVVVRDLSCDEAQAALRRGISFHPFGDPSRLDGKDRLQIVWPVARRFIMRGTSNELFDTSRGFSGKSSSFGFLLTRVDYPSGPNPDPPRRFTDAVAVAGLHAYGSYSRRAVVLVLRKSGRDDSVYQPAPVRRYLGTLRVPLFVWSLAEPAARPAASAAWGETQDISTGPGLEKAVASLRRDLDRQSIVWLEGRHLPQDIVLRDGADGLALVR
jgi:hypothetical protein